MYCVYCGAELPANSNFCCVCGKPTNLQSDGEIVKEKVFETPDLGLFGCDESVAGNVQTNVNIVQIGPNREAVLEYLQSFPEAERVMGIVASMEEGMACCVGQFHYDGAKIILKQLRKVGCKAEIQDCYTLTNIGKNYGFSTVAPSGGSKLERQPLSFGATVGAVVVAFIIMGIFSMML